MTKGVDDIRVEVTWRDHHKRKKLHRRLGADGVLALLDLWLWAGKNRPDGVLTALTAEDVEINAQWTGEPGALVTALLEVRLLDQNGGVMVLHDWPDHQGWATGAARRSESARVAALAKWAARDATAAGSNATAAENGCDRMPTAAGNDAPSPSPSPSPSPDPQRDPESERERPPARTIPPAPAPAPARSPGAILHDAWNEPPPGCARWVQTSGNRFLFDQLAEVMAPALAHRPDVGPAAFYREAIAAFVEVAKLWEKSGKGPTLSPEALAKGKWWSRTQEAMAGRLASCGPGEQQRGAYHGPDRAMDEESAAELRKVF